MRAPTYILNLALILTLGCFGSRTKNDGEPDGGSLFVLESGAFDAEDSHPGPKEQGFGPSSMDSGTEGGQTAVCGNNIREGAEICDGPDPPITFCEGQDVILFSPITCTADCLNFVIPPMCEDRWPELDSGFGFGGLDDDDTGV